MSKKVLIIDDDIAILDSLSVAFKNEGYTAKTTRNGIGILQVIKDFKPHVIILDYALPGDFGDIISRQLKIRHDTKDIPIILISASYRVKKFAFSAGADHFLEKPYDIENLLQLVKICFSSRYAI